MTAYDYKVIIEPDETIEKALENIRDAIFICIEGLEAELLEV